MGVFSSIAEKYLGIDRRKSPRKTVVQTAWIYIGSDMPPLVCVLWDISEEGARLVIPSPDTLPDYFYLLMSRDERPGRRCRVVWRKGANVGLSFVAPATVTTLRDDEP